MADKSPEMGHSSEFPDLHGNEYVTLVAKRTRELYKLGSGQAAETPSDPYTSGGTTLTGLEDGEIPHSAELSARTARIHNVTQPSRVLGELPGRDPLVRRELGHGDVTDKFLSQIEADRRDFRGFRHQQTEIMANMAASILKLQDVRPSRKRTCEREAQMDLSNAVPSNVSKKS